MTLTVANVQLDVPADRYDEVVTFWATALSATPRAVDATFTHLDGARAELGVHLQRLPEDAPAGAHLDLDADDVAVETARLLDLGATHRWTWDDVEVLADPAGTLLCVCPGPRREVVAGRDHATAYLDAVAIDVPPDVQTETAAFWAAALRVDPFEPNYLGDSFLWSDGLRSVAGPFDLGVQRLRDASPARIHLDTISDDVTGEVARLTGAGATVVAELPRWTVLADPVGTVFCVVDASGPPTTAGSGS